MGGRRDSCEGSRASTHLRARDRHMRLHILQHFHLRLLVVQALRHTKAHSTAASPLRSSSVRVEGGCTTLRRRDRAIKAAIRASIRHCLSSYTVSPLIRSHEGKLLIQRLTQRCARKAAPNTLPGPSTHAFQPRVLRGRSLQRLASYA